MYQGYSLDLLTWRRSTESDEKRRAQQSRTIQRSRISPWPSTGRPQSFTPRSRLMADITSPPTKPIDATNSDIAAACQKLNGVIHHRPAPSAVAHATPPTSPSTVFDGDTVAR